MEAGFFFMILKHSLFSHQTFVKVQFYDKGPGFWAFEEHLPYQKYQRPPILVRYIYCGCDVGTLCFFSHAFFLYFIHMQKFSTNLCVVFGENCIAGMSVAGGALFFQILACQLTLSHLRDQIMPTNYYTPPPLQIFRPSDIPTLDATNACM